MKILGIHGGVTVRQHEPAASVVIDGRVEAICEEERYLRIKSCYGLLPVFSIRAALKQCNLQIEDIDLVVTSGETYNQFERVISEFIQHHFGFTPPVVCVNHQLAHLATAFYGSGFDESIVLSLDASGDGLAGSYGYASKEKGITIYDKIPNTNSLGLFYTTMTHYLGFGDGDEYKVMGLAPYGRPNIDLSKFLKDNLKGWTLEQRYIRSNPPVLLLSLFIHPTLLNF